MTHRNNYEYVKKWREVNKEKYLEANRRYTLNRYYYNQAIKELYKIDSSLFL
jgi:hypothetical protein